MFSHIRRSETRRMSFAALLIVVLMLAGMPHAALAQAADPDATAGRINDSVLEFGVWWVEDYPPAGAGGSDLPATRPDALGLRDKLTSDCKLRIGWCWINWPTPQWTARFVYGNSNAWASDFRGAGSGGSENFYIDTVDLAYFAGHGSRNGISFGAGSPAPTFMNKSEVVGVWGDRDMDWIALAACNVLDDPVSNLQDWASTMNGVRLILGFKTVMNDVPHGREFGAYLRDGYSLTQAWFKAADKLQSQNRVARVLAEDTAYFNDKWFNHNSTTVVNGTKYYQTHTVGSEPARAVDIAQLQGQMPVLQVEPLSLADAEARADGLEAAFGITFTVPQTESVGSSIAAIRQDGGGILYSEDGTLEYDSTYGLFLHADMDNLWVTDNPVDQMAAAGVPMMILTEEDAAQLADSFLAQNGLKPGDAQFYEVASDTMSTMEEQVSAAGETVWAVTAEKRLNYQVIYSRVISVPLSLVVAGGSQDPLEFSVMGPGSKLKVYVNDQVPAGLSAAEVMQQSILGGMGGYRQILDPITAAETGALRTVDMLPQDVIEKLFNSDLEASVSLDHIPLPPDEIVSRDILTLTAAYWEGPMGYNQGELIPVYALEVNNTLSQDGGGTYDIPSTTYIPVNPEYMPPLARITTDADLDANIAPGDVLTFVALDASLTLDELGLDPTPGTGPTLDFNLGTPDGLFTYDWYLNEVSDETKLGVGQTLEYTVGLSGNVDAKSAGIGTQRIILVVTDSLKNSEPRTAQAVVTLNAVPPLLLPSVSSSE